jgi:iron-sulfur cluster assembly accessory protein
MAEQKQAQLITKDTTIADVVMTDPKKSRLLTEIMMNFGIHCTGCGAASFETLEQGVLGHGFSQSDLNNLISELNRALESGDESVKEHSGTCEVSSEFKLTFTPLAIEKVKESMKQGENKKSTLKVSVLAGGCSGFLYDLQFIDKPVKEDINFNQGGINIAVDKNSTEMLNGIEIDYVDTLMESGFKFNNPNASAGCGCGKSFG